MNDSMGIVTMFDRRSKCSHTHLCGNKPYATMNTSPRLENLIDWPPL